MSQNVQPLQLTHTLDPTTNIDNKRTYNILKGGQQVSYKQFVSTSYTNTTTSFTCPPPNLGILVNRKVYIVQPVRLVFSGNGSGTGNIVQANYDAFRSFPIASCTNTLNVTLNNTSVSINLSDVILK